MARQIAIEIFAAIGIGALLGLFGPFGTYAFGPGLRMAYWISFIVLGYLIFRPVIIVSGWLADHSAIPEFAARAIALAIASIPMTLLVVTMLSGFDLSRAIRRDDLPQFYAQVLLIGVVVNFLFAVLLNKRGDAAPISVVQSEPVTQEPATPALYSRLPPGFGDVIAMRSEDHYVRVYSYVRDVLILMRLRDAIAELGAADGLQPHRSWWVARRGVSTIAGDGRTISLKLINGLSAPVSRDGAGLLKQAGWR